MDITTEGAIRTMKEKLSLGDFVCKVLNVVFIPRYSWLKAKPVIQECQGNSEWLVL